MNYIKTLFLLAFVGALSAQTLSVAASTTTPKAGDTVSVTYSISGATATSSTAIQWDSALSSASIGFSVTETGQAIPATLTGKAMEYSNGRYVVYSPTGATATAVLPNGPVSTASIAVPSAAKPGQSFTLTISNALGADATGGSATVSPAGALIFTIPFDITDLNKDGKTDSMDIRLMVSQILTKTCLAGYDQNGDGICNIRDVVLIALKAN